MFPVAVLCGGLATRLYPLTSNVPKILLEVAGKPFIFHQLENLREQGVENVVLCVGYLGEKIQEIVGNGEKLGLNIEYSFDGAEQRGTGGAIRNALPKLGGQFFIMYGDSFLCCSFADIQSAFCKQDKLSLLTVFSNQGMWDRSNVFYESGVPLRYNKVKPEPSMSYIDYGLSVFAAEAFEFWADIATFDLADVYSSLCEKQQMSGFEVVNRFYEVGSKDGLREADRFLRKRMEDELFK